LTSQKDEGGLPQITKSKQNQSRRRNQFGQDNEPQPESGHRIWVKRKRGDIPASEPNGQTQDESVQDPGRGIGRQGSAQTQSMYHASHAARG
jgi:hypothetical protein